MAAANMNRIAIKARVAQILTSRRRHRAMQALAETRRRLTRGPHRLRYFHCLTDPYSHLMVQVLPEIAQRFQVEIVPHVIGGVDPQMLLQPELQAAYARVDAGALAGLYGLDLPLSADPSSPRAAMAAASGLAEIAGGQPDRFWQAAQDIGTCHWSGTLPDGPVSPRGNHLLRAAETRLRRMGNYLPATLYHAGSWYWGLDRLHHLETALGKLGRGDGAVRYVRTWSGVFDPAPDPPAAGDPPLELFLSARSPYSYVALYQARRFADALGLRLELRPVLPLVMRNLSVPRAKALAILMDAAREAEFAGLDFGRIADPLGPGIERLYALADHLRRTRPEALEPVFRAALRGIFAQGLDMATDPGLCKVAASVGLETREVTTALQNDAWRGWVEDNRTTLTGLGLWGVPSLRFGGTATWGQDRFWRIRQAVLAHRAARR